MLFMIMAKQIINKFKYYFIDTNTYVCLLIVHEATE